MGNTINVNGDIVGGDKVGGDKVYGDKVYGDKINNDLSELRKAIQEENEEKKESLIKKLSNDVAVSAIGGSAKVALQMALQKLGINIPL